MKKTRLGINIDHIATIRNARGVNYPDPLKAALIAQNIGVDSITIHLREDRRHINDLDLKKIKRKIKIPLNLEMAPTKEMLAIAARYKPDFVCLVPEKRREITTEGGLNLNKKTLFIKKIIQKLKKNNIRTSLFIEPKISDIMLAKKIGANCIEIHTGNFCNLFNKKKNFKNAFLRIKNSAEYAHKIGLDVHAGHGLNHKSIRYIAKIKHITEFNIGHSVIANALFIGLENSIKKIKKVLNK